MSWIAGGIELLAKYLCGNKNKWGWIVHLISGVLWMIVAINNPDVAGGLALIVIPSMYLNIRNFIVWKKSDKLRKGVNDGK